MLDGKILVIDDNKSILSALELLLQDEFKVVKTLSNPNQISSFPDLKSFDIAFLDMNFTSKINTGNEGLFWLKELKKLVPDLHVIMITAYGTIDLAINALKLGASDFILKPWNNSELLNLVKNAYANKIASAKKSGSKPIKGQTSNSASEIIGNSEELASVIALVDKVSNTDVNILITGENGTGKELIAKELHKRSQRKDKPFISVDMGSISESLFESELFGHVKGAFTDAYEHRQGKFEAAHLGTLFLDEIGNLSLQMQSKLLSAIQNKTIFKLGSNKPIAVDIRLVCATNCDLDAMVKQGTFRQDLLYRINVIRIALPPLRKRKTDIAILASYFLKIFNAKYERAIEGVGAELQKKMLDYTWPGNIRELKHAIERAVILAEGRELTEEDLVFSETLMEDSNEIPETLAEMELYMITNAIKEYKGNMSAAASKLGISRQTMYNKIKKINSDV